MATQNTPITSVTINGKSYDLKKMPVQQGLELYNALPEDYRAQADLISTVLTTFASVQKVAQKESLDPTELAKDWVRTASNTEGAKAIRQTMSEAKRRALKELDAQRDKIDFEALVKMVPGGEAAMTAVNVASGTGKVLGVAASASAAAIDGGFNGPARMWNMVSTLGAEGWGKIVGYGDGAPSDNAKAFAAATMALRYQAVQDRHAMPLWDWNPADKVDSQIGSNPVEYGKASFGWAIDWVRQNVPFVDYLVAAYRWVVGAGWKEGNPSYGAILAQVQQDIAVEGKQAPADGKHFARLADREMWDKEGQAVKSSLDAAIEVAGLKSNQGVSTVATVSQVTARNTDGVDVTYDRGQVTGQVTPGDRVAQAGHELAGDGPTAMQAITVGTAAASSVTVLNNGAKGFVRSITAHVTNPAPATEKLMQWAHKPVQFGVGETAVHGLKGKLLNLPGTIANLGGRFTGWVAGKAASLSQTTAAKVGSVTWGAVVAPTIETARLVQGKVEGNEGKVENASNALTVIAGDAAIGAAAGALILGPVGAAGGAVIGASVGGVVTLVGELFDSKKLRGFERVSEEMSAKPDNKPRQPDAGTDAKPMDETFTTKRATSPALESHFIRHNPRARPRLYPRDRLYGRRRGDCAGGARVSYGKRHQAGEPRQGPD
jgi:hypothetical protein